MTFPGRELRRININRNTFLLATSKGKAVASRNKCTEAKIVMFICGCRNEQSFFVNLGKLLENGYEIARLRNSSTIKFPTKPLIEATEKKGGSTISCLRSDPIPDLTPHLRSVLWRSDLDTALVEKHCAQE